MHTNTVVILQKKIMKIFLTKNSFYSVYKAVCFYTKHKRTEIKLVKENYNIKLKSFNLFDRPMADGTNEFCSQVFLQAVRLYLQVVGSNMNSMKKHKGLDLYQRSNYQSEKGCQKHPAKKSFS